MRTTVNINDDLLVEAKLLAARRGAPLGAVVDDALRSMLARSDSPAGRTRRVTLETDGGSGLQPGVDLEDRDRLAELLGENRLPDAVG